MSFLRKTDFCLQCLLLTLLLVSLPFLFIYGFLAGLFILGAWQLFSAAATTRVFIANGFQKEIGWYWTFTGLIMGILFLCVPLGQWFNPDDVQVLGCIGLIPAAPVGVYYLVIYQKLIRGEALKEEVSGLVKSKH